MTEPKRLVFLKYDPIHIIKKIYSIWITEKSQIPKLTHPDLHQKMTGKWSDLVELYNLEASTMDGLFLSKLQKASVAPSNIQKQKGALALSIFCHSAGAALKSSSISNEFSRTTGEINALVVQLFKVFDSKN